MAPSKEKKSNTSEQTVRGRLGKVPGLEPGTRAQATGHYALWYWLLTGVSLN